MSAGFEELFLSVDMNSFLHQPYKLQNSCVLELLL
jgi:hypothetical protein